MKKKILLSKSAKYMGKIRFNLLIIMLLTIFVSCQKFGKKGNIDPDDTIKGRKVMELNSDKSPKVVYYYQVDENGNITNEKVREIYYFPGKKKYVEGNIKNNSRDGQWHSYFPDGKVNSEAFYVQGKEHGVYKVYRENGKLFYVGHYNMGICDGEWRFYDEKGLMEKKILADSNTIVCGSCSKCIRIKTNKSKDNN